MVFHWHRSIRTLILPTGSKIVGLLVEGERPTTVTLDLDDLNKLIKQPEYLNHLAGSLRPIPRAHK